MSVEESSFTVELTTGVGCVRFFVVGLNWIGLRLNGGLGWTSELAFVTSAGVSRSWNRTGGGLALATADNMRLIRGRPRSGELFSNPDSQL
jgi:hypothetical protein